jgi:hypothetical protein
MLRSPVPLVLLWGPDGWPEAAGLNTRVMAVCMAGFVGTVLDITARRPVQLLVTDVGLPEAREMLEA